MNVSSGITSSSSGMNVSTLSTPSIYAHPQTAPPLSSAPMPRRFPGQHGFVHPSTMGPPRPYVHVYLYLLFVKESNQK